MKIIQVVGTNGKGSTVAFIEAILQKNGISCGLFTSPHLSCARERIRINGQMISESDFVWAIQHVLNNEKNAYDASFFEVILAMAMALFQKYGVQVAILEAGLGGRLDATTATLPDILGITTIDFDHQNILGSTLKEIATEKIAASRRGQIVITVEQLKEAEDAIFSESKNLGSLLEIAALCDAPVKLYGSHQKINAGLAWTLVHKLGFDLKKNLCLEGLLAVNWPGRFEIMATDTPTVLDGAHNPSGIAALILAMHSHPRFFKRPVVLVYGSLEGPNMEKKVALLKQSGLDIKHVFIHQSKNPRASKRSSLKNVFVEQGFSLEKLSYLESFQKAEEKAFPDATILVCGSLYTVGEIRAQLLSIDMDERLPNY